MAPADHCGHDDTREPASTGVNHRNWLKLAVGGGALPLSERLHFVSVRTSFEIIRKAVAASVAVVAAVSAPSSLAIDLARAANVTVLGLVRGAAFNTYTHAERVHLTPLEGRTAHD